jgi:hypothetical protein
MNIEETENRIKALGKIIALCDNLGAFALKNLPTDADADSVKKKGKLSKREQSGLINNPVSRQCLEASSGDRQWAISQLDKIYEVESKLFILRNHFSTFPHT